MPSGSRIKQAVYEVKIEARMSWSRRLTSMGHDPGFGPSPRDEMMHARVTHFGRFATVIHRPWPRLEPRASAQATARPLRGHEFDLHVGLPSRTSTPTA